MSIVAMGQLLGAGVRFGHQIRRWDPKMKPYISTQRNGIYIIDLQKTVRMLDDIYNYVKVVAQNDGVFLFVGTKKQVQEAIKEEATHTDQYYVNQRWLGGTLTSWITIQSRIKCLEQLEAVSGDGTFDLLPKKEVALLIKEMDKLQRFLGGIEDMSRIPGVMFVVDPEKEKIVTHETNKLGTPVIAMVDINTDPTPISVIIPANNDAIRAIRLIAGAMADAIIEGKQGGDDENAGQKMAGKAAESTDEKSVEEVANETDED